MSSDPNRPTSPKTRSFEELAHELRAQYSATGNVRAATLTELLGEPTRTVSLAAIEPATALR